MTYRQDAPRLRFAPIHIKLAALGGLALAMAVCAVLLRLSLSHSLGEWADAGTAPGVWAVTLLVLAGLLFSSAVAVYRLTPDTVRIRNMVRFGLFSPLRGNPLHLRDGELLPQIRCVQVSEGQYDLIISAQQGVTVDAIINAAPAISATLNHRFRHYAITQTDADVAFCCVTFRLEDVKADRSLTFEDVEDMLPEKPTMLRVDKVTSIDLTTSGSMLVAGKTRSGKTTGVISLLLQVLLCGRDEYGSQVVIIDPKQAELSRLPHTVTLDKDGEARAILAALKGYGQSIVHRQQILNDLSEAQGDAVKWWDAGFKPSFLFVDEYVACRAILPKKPAKDSDYCLDSFDALVKRIVTTGASAGCFIIISIAEASVQEGGLPAMLRSAMSTRVLFRPTLPEGRLMWDAEKLADFVTDRVYGPGDAWFSSTDGIHDAVSCVHFMHLDFAVYRELGRLLQSYYS